MSSDWIAEQIGIIRNLKGQTVTRLVATEMALCGGEGDGPPEFSRPNLPFLQASLLYLRLATGRTVVFVTYQNDSNWGLCLNSDLQPGEPELDAGSDDRIWRTRELVSFPLGQVTSVEVSRDDEGDISEVILELSGDAILLLAGEVCPHMDGTLDVTKGDESILLFRDPEQKNEVKFWNSND